MEQLECEEVVADRERVKGESWWKRMLKQRLPILRWARGYGREAAAADAVAGLTLGLTLVPQSIAYAALADLPVQHGLYTSFMGTILYTFLGTVKEVSIGPTSLMALLTLQTCRGLSVEYVVLLTFLSGWVVMFMGVLRLGFLVELISPSVTSGFTSATAVIIVVAQLKGVLGLSFTAESVAENVSQLAARAHLVRPQDCALAAVCCTALLLLRKLKDLKVGGPRVRRALWLISIARNAIVVLAAATFAYCTHTPGQPLVLLSGRVAGGLPHVALPAWSAPGTNGTDVALPEMVRRLGGSLIMLPAVMVLANIAIAKAFSDNGRVDATQEMVALGLCNVAGSLVGAMAACGAFTRSAVGHASGVRSPAAGLVAGIITLLALMFLTEYFYFIPKACLSSVLICAVIFMIDYRIVRVLWRESRVEVAVVAATFALSVALSVEAGVLGGAAAALAALLHRLLAPAPAPSLHRMQVLGMRVVRVRVGTALVFANAARVLDAALPHTVGARALLLDCGALRLLDHAALQVLKGVAAQCKECGQQFLPYNACQEIAEQLGALGLGARVLTAPSAAEALAAAESKEDIECAAETDALLQKTQAQDCPKDITSAS